MRIVSILIPTEIDWHLKFNIKDSLKYITSCTFVCVCCVSCNFAYQIIYNQFFPPINHGLTHELAVYVFMQKMGSKTTKECPLPSLAPSGSDVHVRCNDYVGQSNYQTKMHWLYEVSFVAPRKPKIHEEFKLQFLGFAQL